ncbi:MAG: hypothetical protein SFX19_09715 [Alphaproteobacteria bacterium]|nr:hypothetical protein [Alphaproteobacteria bacterium]
MRDNTARKIQHHTETRQQSAEIIDLAHVRDVARIAEEACHIPGNTESCDFEEFMQRYDMQPSGYFE